VARKASSSRWLRRQDRDPLVRRARQEGWRSRAVYKLEELDRRNRLLSSGQVVVDLGAAPGGWSQYATQRVGDSGRVYALDLLDMDPLPGVEYIRGDFSDEAIYHDLLQKLGDKRVNLVLSDMAPNISGNRSVDQPRAMLLAELAQDFAGRTLERNGTFVCKLFHGEGFDNFVRNCRQQFREVRVRKPAASRPSSRETYLVARTIRL